MCCGRGFFKQLVLSFDRSDAGGSGLELFGFFLPMGRSIQLSEEVQGQGQIGVIRPERLLPDRDRALPERLRLRVLALDREEHRQIVEVRRHVGMIRAKRLLPVASERLQSGSASAYWRS